MRIDATNHILEYDPGNNGSRVLDNRLPRRQPDSSKPVPTSSIDQAVAELNRFFSSYHLQFTLHQASGRHQVKMIDANTQEVIREWPSDAILEISARFKQILEEDLGILLDTLI